MLDDGDMKHLGCRCAVEVFPILKSIQHPLFLRLPCEDAGFDGAEIGHDELAALFGHEHCADELRKNIRGVAVDAFHHVKAAHLHQIPRLLQRGDMVLREILQLYAAPGPSLCAIRTGELKQSMRSAVLADVSLRRLILLHRGLCHLQTQLHHIQCFTVRTMLIQISNERCDILFSEGIDLDAAIL